MVDRETQPGDESTPAPRLGVALLGGLRLGGRLRLGERLIRIALIGGVDLDVGEAEFAPSGELTIIKVSLIGGVELRVPAGAAVEVHGFAIGGRSVEAPASEMGAPTPRIVIRAFGLLGGVKVRRARPA